jgi:hypothetical protein
MFMMSEYAICVLLVITVSALLVIVCGAIYLLNAAVQLVLRASRSKGCRPPEWTVREDASAIADRAS